MIARVLNHDLRHKQVFSLLSGVLNPIELGILADGDVLGLQDLDLLLAFDDLVFFSHLAVDRRGSFKLLLASVLGPSRR